MDQVDDPTTWRLKARRAFAIAAAAAALGSLGVPAYAPSSPHPPEGIVLHTVVPNSALDRAGLEPGD
ncbi:MAG: hypothetical protein AAF725_17355, partial [Acidobacteriota bacterium]